MDGMAIWGFSPPCCPKSLGHFLTFATEAMVQSSRGRGSAWSCGAAGIASAEGGNIDEGAAITWFGPVGGWDSERIPENERDWDSKGGFLGVPLESQTTNLPWAD